MHDFHRTARLMVRLGLTFIVASAVVGLGIAQAQAPEGAPTKGKGLERITAPKLKPGALPGPSKLPLDTSRKLAQNRPKLDPATLRKAGAVGKAGADGGDDTQKVGISGKGGPVGGKAGATAEGKAALRAPPGVEDKSAAAKVPAWRQTEESEEEEKPTLSADFIKNCAQLSPGVKVHLDIYDEELEAVVKLIACMTGKNIILAKPLKGKKITIYSPTLVTANEAYKAFLTALEANGFTISKQGRFLRIIEIKDFAKQSDPFLPTGSMPPAEDRMVTQIVGLVHVDAQEINEVIGKLASPNAQIIVYAPSNSLIMTELGSNLRKLRTLIKELDVPGGQEQLWTYQVLHADAAEIATKIQEVFEDRSGAGGARARPAAARNQPAGRKGAAAAAGASTSSVGESELDVKVSKILADERTNRLLIVTTARSYRKVKSLISKLDIPIPGDGQVHIHQLSHAKAADLANVLSNLSQEARNRQQQGGAGNRRAQARGATTPAAGGKSAAGGSSSSAALFEGEVTVTADEATNALVVTASLKDFISLKRVIDVLDKPRRQVFIETVIMEVSISSDRNVGLSFHGGVPDLTVAGEKAPLIFGSQTGGSSLSLLSALDPSSLTGLAVAAQSERTLQLGDIGSIPAFGVVIKALAKSNDVNIMSAPHILTTDNEEAEIVVGSNVPFIAGGLAGGSGGLGGLASLAGASGASGLGGLGGLGSSLFPTVNVQRQDVALTLKITPRINAQNFVTLEVDQLIEEIESIDQRLGPTTSKRQIKSTVVVGDQNTVVIGGLQKTRQVNSRDAVPFLGEIPIIGYLFRNVARQHERRNLLLLLTPHVIEGPNDFKAIFERKMEEQREFLARFQKEGEVVKLGIDYGKKHGVLEAINKTIKVARDEQRLLQELRNQDRGMPLPQDLDGIDVDAQPVAPAEPDGGSTGIRRRRNEGGDSATGNPSIPVSPVPAAPSEDAP